MVKEPEETKIRNVMQHSYAVSPNTYRQNALSKVKERLKSVWNRRRKIALRRFANDVVIRADREKDLGALLEKINEVVRGGYKLRISAAKTKEMICAREGTTKIHITPIIRSLNEFSYPCSKITSDGQNKQLKDGIIQAKAA